MKCDGIFLQIGPTSSVTCVIDGVIRIFGDNIIEIEVDSFKGSLILVDQSGGIKVTGAAKDVLIIVKVGASVRNRVGGVGTGQVIGRDGDGGRGLAT